MKKALTVSELKERLMEVLSHRMQTTVQYVFNIVGCPLMFYKVEWELIPGRDMKDVSFFLARGQVDKYEKLDIHYYVVMDPTLSGSVELLQRAISECENSTYKIVITNNGTGIECLNCGLISYNKNDINNLFCGKCNKFHLRVVE